MCHTATMAVKVAARAGCCSMDAPEKSLHQWCSRILGFKSSVFISWYNPVQSTNFWIFLSYFLENPPKLPSAEKKGPKLPKPVALRPSRKLNSKTWRTMCSIWRVDWDLMSPVPIIGRFQSQTIEALLIFLLMFREGGENYGDGMRMEL